MSARAGFFVLLGVLVALNLASGILLAILTPLWMGADEFAHYGYIEYLRVHKALPDQRTCYLSQEIETSIYDANWWHLSKRKGRAAPGPEMFYCHGFKRYGRAGSCAKARGIAHSGRSSLAISYHFTTRSSEAIGVFLGGLNVTSSDGVALWVCANGSGAVLNIGIERARAGERRARMPLDWHGWEEIKVNLAAVAGKDFLNSATRATLKVYVSDAAAPREAVSGTIFIDDIRFVSKGKETLVTGFEDEELALRDSARWNWAASHPPLYYLLALPIDLALRNEPIGTRALVLRLFSVLISTFTVMIAALIGRSLFGDQSVAWALVPALLVLSPVPSFHQSSINNDHLVFLLYSALLLLLVRWLGERVGASRVVLLGLLVGLGLLTKLLFVTAIPAVLVFLLLNHRAKRRFQPGRFFALLGLFLAVVIAVSWWWFARNYQLYGMPVITPTSIRPEPPTHVPLSYLDFFLSRRFFGWVGVGWFLLQPDKLDFWLTYAVLGIALLGLGRAGILRLRRKEALLHVQRPGALRLLWWLVLIHFGSVCLVVATGSVRVGRFRALQGRYFLPVITAIAAIWALGVSNLFPKRLRAWAAPVAVGLLALLQVCNVYITNMKLFYPF